MLSVQNTKDKTIVFKNDFVIGIHDTISFKYSICTLLSNVLELKCGETLVINTIKSGSIIVEYTIHSNEDEFEINQDELNDMIKQSDNEEIKILQIKKNKNNTGIIVGVIILCFITIYLILKFSKLKIFFYNLKLAKAHPKIEEEANGILVELSEVEFKPFVKQRKKKFVSI